MKVSPGGSLEAWVLFYECVCLLAPIRDGEERADIQCSKLSELLEHVGMSVVVGFPTDLMVRVHLYGILSTMA